MRATRTLLAVTLLAAAPAFAQTLPDAGPGPFGLDPYRPSDAALVRKFAGAIVAQTPVLDFQKLDSYKPSHAAWLRQDGGIPVWATYWFPAAALDGMPTIERRVVVTAEVETPTGVAPAAPSAARPVSLASVPPPSTGDGIYIVHNQQRWVRAGAPVPASAAFARVGEYGAVGTFRRANDPADLVFVPARPGGPMVPYRRKP
jgi:hypothetical protein